MMIDQATREFLEALHAGAQPGRPLYGYWWTVEGRQSFWWEVDKKTPLPGGRRNIYFGIHPSIEIPKTNARGEPKRPQEVRSQNALIAAIGALFVEYDAKDFGDDKAAALRKVEALYPPPSVVVDSGGGYHCYYLLAQPWVLRSDEDREKARKLQAAWVRLMDGDPQSKDLARVLRVPGTLNHKYQPARSVVFVWCNLETRYAIDELAALAQPFIESDPRPQTEHTNGNHSAWLTKALAGEIAKVVSAPDGLKHQRLRDSAMALGGLVHLGLSEQEIEDGLYAAIEGRAADAKNARKTIQDGIAYGKAKPREIPPRPEKQQTSDQPSAPRPATWGPIIPFHSLELPPFPVDVLPVWLRDYVIAISTEKQTPVDLAAMLALSVLSTCCGRHVVVQATPGWIEPVNLYTITAMPPASGKSPTFAAMMAPIEAYEREQVLAAKHDIARKQNEHDMLEAQLASAKKTAASAKSDRDRLNAMDIVDDLTRRLVEFDVPVEPRLIVDDISSEKLATMLFQQGGRIAALSAEGDIFSIMAGRYSGDSAPNFGVYLKAHAADTLRVDRSNRAEYVHRPALTMGLTVQPDVLRSFADKKMFRGQGLLARFMYAIPKSLVGYRTTRSEPCPQELRLAYAENVKHLLRLIPILASGYSENNGNCGDIKKDCGDTGNIVLGSMLEHLSIYSLSLSLQSYHLFIQFADWLEPQLAEDGGELSHIADWASKLRGGVLRIAGLLHMAEYISYMAPHNSHNSQNAEIGESTLARAIAIAQYLILHARAAFAEIGADPSVVAARKVLAWLEKQQPKEVSRRDIYQAVKGTFRRTADLDPVLELLADHGYVRPRDMDERPGPGRKPSQIYDVNPVLFRAERVPDVVKVTHTAFTLDPSLLVAPTPSMNGAAYRPMNGYEAPAQPDDDLFPGDDPPIAQPEQPRSGFNLAFVRASLQSQNLAGIRTHYTLHRAADIRGMSVDQIVELAEREVGE
jgi:replicative DNA helicase